MKNLTPDHSGQAWVFAGGEFAATHVPVEEVLEHDLFVCVDKGLEHCLDAGFKPSVLIGDMDSVSPQLLSDVRLIDIPRHVYPSRKAASDLEIALQLLSELSLQRVVLLGVSGGRTDHMLFNWQLPILRQWPFQLQFIDATTRCHVLNADNTLALPAYGGQVVSLLPLDNCKGVTTVGLQYALNGATLELGSTLGLSNVAESDSINVSISEGTLLVLVCHSNQ